MYGENEQRFLFKGVIVSTPLKHSLKSRNTGQGNSDQSCEPIGDFVNRYLVMSIFCIKPLSSKLKSMMEAFEVHPNKASIPTPTSQPL